MAVRQAALEAQRADALAAYMDQSGFGLGKGKPFLPLLVSAVVHKVCTTELATVKLPGSIWSLDWLHGQMSMHALQPSAKLKHELTFEMPLPLMPAW